ncbi:MAG: formate dehydrogenase accessory sulfurtransferase FdhD [Pseudomonadota bacterium]
MTAPTHSARGLALGPHGARDTRRSLPEEVPVAVTCNGSTQAVMMCSPQNLEDFAVGFALTEGFVARTGQIESVEVIETEAGIEARLWIEEPCVEALGDRRRAMMGPVGCGLCGIDSLEQAMRDLPVLGEGVSFHLAEIASATEALRAHQPLHDLTNAVHAAGFLTSAGGLQMAREDVGRHNALDKLIGALARDGINPATGAFVITSRVSVEMVQKTVLAGATTLIAVSAPTAHAVRMANASNLTLAAFARGAQVELFTHPQRIRTDRTDVA